MSEPARTWRDDLLERVRALRRELEAITTFYDAEADLWHLDNEHTAREKAA